MGIENDKVDHRARVDIKGMYDAVGGGFSTSSKYFLKPIATSLKVFTSIKKPTGLASC